MNSFCLIAYDFLNREPRSPKVVPYLVRLPRLHNKEDPVKRRKKKRVAKVFVSRGGIRL